MQTDIQFRTVRAHATRESTDTLAVQMRQTGQSALKVHFDRCPHLLQDRLAFLESFDFLTHLALVSGELESLGALQLLPKLKRLELSLLRVSDVVCDSPPALHVLSILDCSTNVLQLVPSQRALRALSLIALDATMLPELTPLRQLRWLKMEQCHRIASVSDLTGCEALTRVVLLEMQALRSLESVAKAPHLRELIIGEAPSMSPDALAVFANHPTLERIFSGISHERTERFRQAAAILRCELMQGYYGTADQFVDLQYGDNDEFSIRLR